MSSEEFKPEMKATLTVSSIPGTTLDMIPVKISKIGITLYDTPGIPNRHSISSLFASPTEAALLVHRKRISPRAVLLRSDITLFLGGLARLDFGEGDAFHATLFLAPNIAIHSTMQYKANEVFIKQYGKILIPVLDRDFRKIRFEKYEFNLKFEPNGVCTHDLEISGLGWISFVKWNKKQGESRLVLYLPEGVQHDLRKTFYRNNDRDIKNRVRTRVPSTRQIRRYKQTFVKPADAQSLN